MKYAVYFTWNDGTEDSFIAYGAADRDMNIRNMISRNEFKQISYSKIYSNGEYGKHIEVIR